MKKSVDKLNDEDMDILFSRTRKFGQWIYDLEAFADTKKQAEAEADRWRKGMGCRARIIKLKNSPYGKYAVYVLH